jgi:hypothetical protein
MTPQYSGRPVPNGSGSITEVPRMSENLAIVQVASEEIQPTCHN